MSGWRGWAWRLGLAAMTAASMSVSAVLIASAIDDRGDDPHASVPAWLLPLGDVPDETVAMYEAAQAHRDLFAHLPCYCGCSLLKPPHASLERCFLRADGSAEPHATGCRICIDIAKDALAMVGEGRTHVEIRVAIDAMYVDTGPPTDTPRP